MWQPAFCSLDFRLRLFAMALSAVMHVDGLRPPGLPDPVGAEESYGPAVSPADSHSYGYCVFRHSSGAG